MENKNKTRKIQFNTQSVAYEKEKNQNKQINKNYTSQSTWEVPRFTLIEIDVYDRSRDEIIIGDLPSQVIGDEFFISWMESEPRWETQTPLHFKPAPKTMVSLSLSLAMFATNLFWFLRRKDGDLKWKSTSRY